MKYWDLLKDLEPAEVREFVKENKDKDDLLAQVMNEPNVYFPFLMKNKSFPETWVLETPEELVPLLLESAISASYNLGLNTLEKIISKVPDQADELLSQQLITFPSMPVTSLFLMRLINSEFLKSASQIISSHPEFQKPEFITLLLKNKISDESIISLAVKSQGIIDQLTATINNDITTFSSHFIDALINSNDINVENINKEIITQVQLSPSAYTKLLTNSKARMPKYGYPNSSRAELLGDVEWNDSLEQVDDNLLRRFLVKNAPVGSKFRLKWVAAYPFSVSAEELISAYKAGNDSDSGFKVNENLVREILHQDLDTIKQLSPIDRLADVIGPVALGKAIRNDVDKALFLFENAPAKFRTVLRQIIPIDKLPSGANERKKSYFNEAILALSEKDLDSFRWAVSQSPYSLVKFSEDTNQSSKKEKASELTIDKSLVLEFTKEELLTLCDSALAFPSNYDEQIVLKHSLKVEEAMTLLEKMNVEVCFDSCVNQASFISKLNAEQLSSLFGKREEVIMQNSKLLESYLKKIKSQKGMEFSESDVKAFSKIMAGEELRSLLNISDNHVLVECLAVKGTDGQYFVTDAQIMNLIAADFSSSDTFWEGLMERNRDLAKKAGEAYVGGSKAMSALIGKKVTIRRKQSIVDKVENVLKELSQSSEEIVEEIFNNGGKLSEFQGRLLNWEKSVLQYGNGRVVQVDSVSFDRLYDLNNQAIKFKVNTLRLGLRHYDPEDMESIFSNLQVESLLVDDASLSADRMDSVIKIKNLLNLPLMLDEDVSFDSKLNLMMAGINFEGEGQFLNSVIDNGPEGASLSVRKLNFLLDRGMVLKESFIQPLIEENLDDVELLKRISYLAGGLSNFSIDSNNYRYSWLEEDHKELLQSLGLRINIVIEDEEEMQEVWKNDLKEQGDDFKLNVERYSSKEKLDIIKFIEQEIDSNYAKLDLGSSNLENLKVITSYESMRQVRSLDSNDLIKVLNIPANISSNKKIMSGIKECVALSDGSLVHKTQSIQKAATALNKSVELLFSDYFDYDNQNAVVPSENINKISYKAIDGMVKAENALSSQNLVMKNKSKGEILRFLRLMTENDREERYVMSTLNMVDQVLEGVEKLNNQVNELIQQNTQPERAEELKGTLVAMDKRIETIRMMDDLDLIHDNLVILLKYLQSDPLEELKQNKYKELENNKKLDKSLGYQLYFPLTRGDLVFLGENNGWCVSYSKSYGDGVIKKGNILVGLCAEGKESDKENVVALAHFVNDDGNYRLEQLRWSNKVKEDDNVDAKDDFDHVKLLSLLLKHLAEVEKKEKI